MKRHPIMLFLLMALVAACGSNGASPSATESEPTVAPTPSSDPSPEDSPAPAETDGDDETALEDMIPDELNGVARTDIPGLETMIANALAQQGMDADDAEFAFASYGEGEAAVVLTAFRVEGMNELAMQTLARALSGVEAQAGADAESVTVAGKEVLKIEATTGEQGVVYMYFAEGAAFTIVSQDPASAEQLLAELP